jgi:ribosomal protein S18 acetylase RimI-like enzyme
MDIIIKKQIWDNHYCQCYHLIDKDIIATGKIEYYDSWINISGIYIYEQYRRQNYFKLLFEKMLDDLKDENRDIYLLVRKDNFIKETYKKYNFKYHSKKIINKINYQWFKLNKI